MTARVKTSAHVAADLPHGDATLALVGAANPQAYIFLRLPLTVPSTYEHPSRHAIASARSPGDRNHAALQESSESDRSEARVKPYVLSCIARSHLIPLLLCLEERRICLSVTAIECVISGVPGPDPDLFP